MRQHVGGRRRICKTGQRPQPVDDEVWRQELTRIDTLIAEGRKLEPGFKQSVQNTWDGWREKSRGTLTFKPEGKLQGVMEERVAAAPSRGLFGRAWVS